MFISTTGPRVVWHGPNNNNINNTFAAALEKRNAYLLYRRFAEMSTNSFNAWAAAGPKGEPEEPWYQQPSEAGDEDYLMENGYSMIDHSAKDLPDSSDVSLHPYSRTGYPPNQMFPTQAPVPDHFYHTWPTAATTATFPAIGPTQWHLVPNNISDQYGMDFHGLPDCEMGNSPAGNMVLSMNSLDYTSPSINSMHGSFSSTGASEMMDSLMVGDGLNQNSWSSIGGSSNHPAVGFYPPPAQLPPHPQPIQSVDVHPPQPPHPHLPRHAPFPGPMEQTVSPKLLRINPSPTHKSSSESNHTSYLAAGSESDRPFTPFEAKPSARPTSQQPGARTARTRRQLPDKSPHLRYVPLLAGGGSSGRRTASQAATAAAPSSTVPAGTGAAAPSPRSKGTKGSSAAKQPKTSTSVAGSRRKHDTRSAAAAAAAAAAAGDTAGAEAGARANVQSATAPAPGTRGSPAASSSSSSSSSASSSSARERSLRDEFLVRSKMAGMTYKEIRRKGGFAEAESTLRGRFRTLTKHRDARVRKPEWTEDDLRLLEQAVRSLSRGDEIAKAKIPWKQVAEYIFENGGTYLFGNSTCRKRWDELVAEEVARGKDARLSMLE